MKRISIYIGLCMMLICTCLPAFAGPEAEFRKLENIIRSVPMEVRNCVCVRN